MVPISELTKRPIQSGRVNLEDLGDGAGFLAALDELAGKRDLLGRQGRGATEPNALRLRGGSAAAGALVDQGSLKLGNAGEDRQHHAPGRRCRIGPRLGQRTQAGLSRVQALGNVEKIACRSREAV